MLNEASLQKLEIWNVNSEYLVNYKLGIVLDIQDYAGSNTSLQQAITDAEANASTQQDNTDVEP